MVPPAQAPWAGVVGQSADLARPRGRGSHPKASASERIYAGGHLPQAAVCAGHDAAAESQFGGFFQPPGQAPRQPASLFKKLDESLVDEEYVRLAG